MSTGHVEVDQARKARSEELRAMGFVHVTGMMTYDAGGTREGYRIEADKSGLGRWDYNNGKTVVVTVDGEVWLRAGGDYGIGLPNPYAKFCPRGSGAFVPCSNGEQVAMHQLLQRVADPYSDCHGHADPNFGLV